MGAAFDVDREVTSDEALTVLGQAIPTGSTAVIASVEESAVEVIDGEMKKLDGEVTRRPVGEVMGELEAAENAADAAAREARRTIRENRKAELTAGLRRARGQAEGEAPRLLTTASARRRLSPATGSDEPLDNGEAAGHAHRSTGRGFFAVSAFVRSGVGRSRLP